jgi:hypothetical protein
MDELRDVVERAERAVGSLSPGQGGFDQLVEYRERRHRHNRAMAGVVAAMVALGGVLGGLALLQALRADTMHPATQSTPSTSPTATPAPGGRVRQRTIDGEPAQQLGPFWFGVVEDGTCLRVKPLSIGPSWTFQDNGYDCVPPLDSDSIHTGLAAGAVHRDGDPGPITRFTTVYGLVTSGTARVDIGLAGGQVLSVSPIDGRFLLVRPAAERPLWVTAVSADGQMLERVDLS